MQNKEDRSWTKHESHGDGSKTNNGANRITNGAMIRLVETTDLARTDATAAKARSGHGAQGEISHVEVHVERSTKVVSESTSVSIVNALDQSNAALMGDAPACDGCGSITVRNGSCYKCMNCGNSMGCS